VVEPNYVCGQIPLYLDKKTPRLDEVNSLAGETDSAELGPRAAGARASVAFATQLACARSGGARSRSAFADLPFADPMSASDSLDFGQTIPGVALGKTVRRWCTRQRLLGWAAFGLIGSFMAADAQEPHRGGHERLAPLDGDSARPLIAANLPPPGPPLRPMTPEPSIAQGGHSQ
jgi:hypothetical protein